MDPPSAPSAAVVASGRANRLTQKQSAWRWSTVLRQRCAPPSKSIDGPNGYWRWRRRCGQRCRAGDPPIADRRRRSGLRARLKTITLGGQPAVRTARKFRGGTRTFRPFLLPDFWVVTMAGSSAAKQSRKDRTSVASARLFDRELEDLPQELRWQEWMLRVEAVIFASAEPVSRETLARVVGKDCSIDLLIEDLRQELSSRPYELVSVAGGWQHRTRPRFAETICASSAPTREGRRRSPSSRRWC